MDNSQLLSEQNKKLAQVSAHAGLNVGSGGFKRHGTGTVINVRYNALVVQEDTVFTEFLVNGSSELVNNGMSAVTFKQGAFLSGGVITGFAISSGSVIAYK
jgi:serine acetyltransferase